MKKTLLFISVWHYFGVRYRMSSLTADIMEESYALIQSLAVEMSGPALVWERLWPNPQEREIVMRLNRANEPTIHRPWIVIPKNLDSIDIMSLSPFQSQTLPTGQKQVIVDIDKQAFGAYDENGTLLRWGPVSTARGYCPDEGEPCNTPIGHFRVMSKEGPDCISKKFPLKTHGGAPMPYCMYFHDGFAMHGSYELPGYNASHGCIRMYTEDAEWLNLEFTDIGTRVIIKG